MTCKYFCFAVPLLLLAGCATNIPCTPRTAAPAPLAPAVPWTVTVRSAAPEQPSLIMVGRGPDEHDWPGRPPGHKWIGVAAELASPGPRALVPTDDIRLVNETGQYPVTAIGYRGQPDDFVVWRPVLSRTPPHADHGMTEIRGQFKARGDWGNLFRFADDCTQLEHYADAYFEDPTEAEESFGVTLKGANGGRELWLAKSPQTVLLLFAVPEEAARLSLQVGIAPPVAVPAF